MLLGLMSGGTYNSHTAVQLLYVVLVVVWSLSYTPECAAKLGAAAGLLPKLVDILKTVGKEKVVRVTCASLRNLLPVGVCAQDMIGAGVMKALSNLQQRKWADEDVKADVDFLLDSLASHLKSMSSWDVYAKEARRRPPPPAAAARRALRQETSPAPRLPRAQVASGRLEWSPSHKSDHFWKDNFKAFEASDCATLKQLVACLSSSDPTTLAVACHDVGEFIKTHPEGRRLVAQFSAKAHTPRRRPHHRPHLPAHLPAHRRRSHLWPHLCVCTSAPASAHALFAPPPTPPPTPAPPPTPPLTLLLAPDRAPR